LDILHTHVALEALYDSAESFPQPRCHPETRVELLDDLWDQMQDPETRVVWLHGPAGAGKSAVMQTLCRRFHNAGILGGSYFFKRNHPTRGKGRVLFATLAYQLAIFDRELGPAISKMVENNPLLVATSIASQLRKLIAKPCLSAKHCTPRILLIDGLDECDGIPIQLEILRSIFRTFRAHALPIQIVIASRPEPEIQGFFDENMCDGLSTMNIEQSFADVETFLCEEFSRIHREHSTMARVSSPWPSGDTLDVLVRNSSGYFTYAATVINFVDDKDFRPTDQLAIILGHSSSCDALSYKSLDKLYFQILSQVPERSRPHLLAILALIFTFPDKFSIYELEQLCGLEDGDVHLTLRRLHSVLAVPSSSEDRIYPIHASFGDFLLNETRSSFFYIGAQERVDVARSLLRVYTLPLANPQENYPFW
ncbi:hypothetical protein FB45DRAFT_758338, partial [Roridomyces roridus]